MANTDNNTIALQVSTTSAYYEAYCYNDAITPGMLCMRFDANTITPHSNNAGAAENMYALEDGYQGRTIDDSYQAGDRVYTRICRSGDVVLAWVRNALPLAMGAFLMSHGGGTLAGNGHLTNITTPEVGGVLAVLLEDYTDEPNPVRMMVQIV
jgi:hypothetical protein